MAIIQFRFATSLTADAELPIAILARLHIPLRIGPLDKVPQQVTAIPPLKYITPILLLLIIILIMLVRGVAPQTALIFPDGTVRCRFGGCGILRFLILVHFKSGSHALS